MIIDGLVQVAGVLDLHEARMLLDCGADLLGFPLRLPVHAPDTSEAVVRQIIDGLDPAVCVLVTYEEDPARLVDLCRFLNVGTVQMHADVPPQILARIKTRSALRIVKSYVVGRETMAPEQFVQAYSPHCDAFITDTFDPDSGASGATGLVHDWTISAELARVSLRPVILAGGLTPANVRQAIRAVCPAGVDVHTGVENPDGSKNPELVRAFVREARAGFVEALRC